MGTAARQRFFDVLVPLLMVGIPLGAIFAVIPYFRDHWHAMCPPDVAYWTGGEAAMAMTLPIPLIIFAGIYGRALDRRLREAQAAAHAAHVPTAPLGAIVKWIAALAAVGCLLGIANSFFGVLCVTPTGLVHRAGYFDKATTYILGPRFGKSVPSAAIRPGAVASKFMSFSSLRAMEPSSTS